MTGILNEAPAASVSMIHHVPELIVSSQVNLYFFKKIDAKNNKRIRLKKYQINYRNILYKKI